MSKMPFKTHLERFKNSRFAYFAEKYSIPWWKKKKNHLKNYAKHACRYNEEIMLREETDFYRTLMKSVI